MTYLQLIFVVFLLLPETIHPAHGAPAFPTPNSPSAGSTIPGATILNLSEYAARYLCVQ